MHAGRKPAIPQGLQLVPSAHVPELQRLIAPLPQLPIPSHASANVTTPATHDCGAPHAVPDDWKPLAVQTASPVVQDIDPVVHGSPVLQLIPALHGPQVPPWQTMFDPQEVPLLTFEPATHTGRPEPQVIVPVLQGFVGWQVMPSVHEPQVPALHTLFVPHEVPGETLPVSVQTMEPVEHDVVPVLHMFVGWQVVPLVQATQLPALQTLLVPHDVPFVTLPLSVHTDVPLWQVVVPVLQGFVG